MKNFLKQLVTDKKVLILGFGREGKSTLNVLKEVDTFSELAIADMKPVDSLYGDNIKTYFGKNYLDCIDDYDVVFKSPGIALPKPRDEYKGFVTSQTELFLKLFAEQTIGITGTKGKSTTSSLTYHALKTSGVDCVFAGNIGIPVFDMLDEISDKTTVVLEMSCHQLEYIDTAPHIAVLLNLYEDHLDRYKTFAHYSNIKRNIYKFQKAEDVLFCNPVFKPQPDEGISQVKYIDANVLPANVENTTTLRGKHNLFNIAVAYEICKLFSIKDEDFVACLPTFEPLAHRLQYVGKVDGIEYYDDSISTTVQSAISAMNSIKNAGTILIGGMDRGIDYTELIDYLLNCTLDEVVFMYDSGKRIFETIKALPKKTNANFVYLSDLKSAVDYAKKSTKKEKACILSPAAASYGVFKNFEERGDVFQSYVFADK